PLSAPPPQVLQRLVLPFSRMSYCPPNPLFFPRLEAALDLRAGSSPLATVNILMSLFQLQRFPPRLLPRVFCPAFARSAAGWVPGVTRVTRPPGSPYGPIVRRYLSLLDAAVGLEQPDYRGPRLPAGLKVALFQQPMAADQANRKYSYKGLVAEALRQLVGEENYKQDEVLPPGYCTDFLLWLDGSGRVLPIRSGSGSGPGPGSGSGSGSGSGLPVSIVPLSGVAVATGPDQDAVAMVTSELQKFSPFDGPPEPHPNGGPPEPHPNGGPPEPGPNWGPLSDPHPNGGPLTLLPKGGPQTHILMGDPWTLVPMGGPRTHNPMGDPWTPVPMGGGALDPYPDGGPLDPGPYGGPLDPHPDGGPPDPHPNGGPLDPHPNGGPLDPHPNGGPPDPHPNGGPLDPCLTKDPSVESQDSSTLSSPPSEAPPGATGPSEGPPGVQAPGGVLEGGGATGAPGGQDSGQPTPPEPEPDQIQRVVLSVNDRWHYCHNSEVLVGSRAMRDRHLRLLGYRILQLPYQELEKLHGVEQVKLYLRRKLEPPR
ncbi:LOW QUALITY PROTEIN: uncharacterized protein ACNS7B_003510, partial [Menidia menidia]